jgi:hypothetical protein
MDLQRIYCPDLGSDPRREFRRPVLLELRRNGEPSEFCIISGFRLGRWDVADGLKQPPVIEPVDPLERGHLDGLQVTPRPKPMNRRMSPYER